MLLLLFAVWIALNGKWTAEIAVVGVVVSALLYLFCWKFLGYSPKKDWQFIKRFPKFLCYLLYLLKEIAKAVASTIRLIWSPNLVAEPKLVTFHTKLKTDTGKVLLADSITITPGTVTVNVHGDKFMVHCLDADFAVDVGKEMEEKILKIEDVA